MKRLLQTVARFKKALFVLLILLLTGYYFCLPKKLFTQATCTVLFDSTGVLLGAKIAEDGQWRFPYNPIVPERFKVAITTFEDKRFEQHWGVDPLALGRAIYYNVAQQRRVSGASTLTMQSIRLSRNNPSRTFTEKIWEMILATRMEFSYSKAQILSFYASYAPFGGNVVGLDAAAWKYFGRPASQLSWAESAMLAVLPNSPALIHPGRNRSKLKAKRNALLDRLWANGNMDSISCVLAKMEPIPEKPKPLPRLAPHLLEYLHQKHVASGASKIIHSTISAGLQERVNSVAHRHYERLRLNEINNLAVLVVEVSTGNVVAYTGNAPKAAARHSPAVDVVQAARSTGSILKPILYASMLHDGHIASGALFPDIPTGFGSYRPKNFDGSHVGAVAANTVITRSLNIPSVFMLRDYGVLRFADKLKQLGMKSLTKPANHYGLTLILGGAETSLWDLGQMYSGMARSLKHYGAYNGAYAPNSFAELNLYKGKGVQKVEPADFDKLKEHNHLSASAVWHAFESMRSLTRPGEEVNWETFPSAQKVAWKTGTSFGFRDAWAVGCTPDYVVAVWTGNADGEGRPGLVGVHAAAPVLFDVFSLLNTGYEWFEQPYDDMQTVEVCALSGHLAGKHCTHKIKRSESKAATGSPICPYHRPIRLDQDQMHRVDSECESVHNMVQKSYFILPAVQAWYYKKKHPDYEELPPYRPDCATTINNRQGKELIVVYPEEDVKIYIPVNLDETKSKTVFEAKHRAEDAILYWHIDETFIGATTEFHFMECNPPVGKHTLTGMDHLGNKVSRPFEILAEE